MPRTEVSDIRLALDTNIALDWLVFDDARADLLRQHVPEGRIVVVTHPPAIDELKRVLAYPKLKISQSRQEEIIASYRAQTSVVSMPEGFSMESLLLPEGFPRCRDRDDQHFMALGYHAKVDALVSRDKALLCLSGRAAGFGLRISGIEQMGEMI
jgi:putative PIN family toxin of toxin-antitoxin system